MAVPQAKKKYTPAEYYALERDATYKSDYYEGEIFDMSGGTADHSLITTNLVVAIGLRLRDKPCTVYESSLRLKISSSDLRIYPDASVYCAPLEFDPEDPFRTTALNPTAVFEVLSPSTETYDRGFKAQNYRKVDSLKLYVLIAQDTPHIELHERTSEGLWTIRDASGLDAVVSLKAIGVDLPLAEIYDKVQFPPSVSPLENKG